MPKKPGRFHFLAFFICAFGQAVAFYDSRHSEGPVFEPSGIVRLAHNMIAGIHMNVFACNSARQVTKKKQRGIADFACIHTTVKRRPFFHHFQNAVEVADTFCRQGANRAGRDRVDADIELS